MSRPFCYALACTVIVTTLPLAAPATRDLASVTLWLFACSCVFWCSSLSKFLTVAAPAQAPYTPWAYPLGCLFPESCNFAFEWPVRYGVLESSDSSAIM